MPCMYFPHREEDFFMECNLEDGDFTSESGQLSWGHRVRLSGQVLSSHAQGPSQSPGEKVKNLYETLMALPDCRKYG